MKAYEVFTAMALFTSLVGVPVSRVLGHADVMTQYGIIAVVAALLAIAWRIGGR